jgi:hypothetical protein
MNYENVKASSILSDTKRVNTINEGRASWKLSEWCAHFNTDLKFPSLTPEEIAAGALWLIEHEYPVPVDCPKRPEASPKDGGCPTFKPMCLIYPVCQFARGMCGLISSAAKCPTCSKEFYPEQLRDSLSKREFEISGMCQKCQDKTFTPQKDDPCDGCSHKGTRFCKEECPI